MGRAAYRRVYEFAVTRRSVRAPVAYPTTLSAPGAGREHGFCQVGTRQRRWAMAKIGNHAVVWGASMAGLLAARSLADFFDTVTVVERDPLPDTGTARRGVP